MMETIGKYSIILVISALLTWYASFLGSNYLEVFLLDNAILLAVTVFTIHAASIGILLSQLEIISYRTGLDFRDTIVGIRQSFVEFFILIFFMTLCLVALNTCVNKINNFISDIPYIKQVLVTLVTFSVIAMIAIVYDTSKAILRALEFLSNQ